MARVQPVAITGLGCICSAGLSVDSCLTTLFATPPQPAAPTRITSDHPTRYPVFEVPHFAHSPEWHRTSALAVHAAREALGEAGLDEAARRDLRIGVCVGTTVGCVMSDEPFCRTALAHDDPDMEIFSLKLRNNPADVVARTFALAGPRQTVVNACSSGTDAIGIGASWIRAGVCDVVLAGGTDEIGRSTYLGFVSLMISDDSPCKPFDVRRKGLNLGEGAGILVLESDAALRRRGGRARARVVGYGSSADAYHPTAPRPDGAGLRRALAETLATAGASSGEVAFVNAHGTGTQDNDRVEGTVLADVLPGVPYFSTKGATGHTLGAAGAVEAVFTAACLIRGSIPPSAGFEQPDPAIPHGPTKEACAVSGPLALSTSLAFGGNNAVVAIGVAG